MSASRSWFVPIALFFLGVLGIDAGCGGNLVEDAGSDGGDGGDSGDSGDGCTEECMPGFACRHGECVNLCVELDCPTGWHCEAGTCILDDPCDGVTCSNVGEVCQGGLCVAGEADADRDGHQAREDCNDNNPAIYPGALEACNGENDDCDMSTSDGATECPDLCCGIPPSCHAECCYRDHCGLGDWQCEDFNCNCLGVVCEGRCHSGGVCCDDDDCGPGQRCSSDQQCSCSGVMCDGVCFEGGECCGDDNCDGERRCTDAHQCECIGVECDGSCFDGGECCDAGGCSGGDWQCVGHRCDCGGTECADGHCVVNAEDCCAAPDCGGGDWTCVDHGCDCDGVVCDGHCFGGETACCHAPSAASASTVAPQGDVCSPALVLSADGVVAGLSIGVSEYVEIEGHAVTACLTADLGRQLDGATVTVTARASGGPVCGNSCGAEYCGTSRYLLVFVSDDATSFEYLGVATLTATLGEHVVTATTPFRHILVCRSGAGYLRDHVEVDFVEACLTP